MAAVHNIMGYWLTIKFKLTFLIKTQPINIYILQRSRPIFAHCTRELCALGFTWKLNRL